MIEKINQNKLYKQTKNSCAKLKFFIHFYCISSPFIFLRRRKILKALYSGQPLSDTVPANSMLCMRASKQLEDPAGDYFQTCQNITVGLKFLI